MLQQAQVVSEIAEQGKDPLAGQFRLGVIYTIGPYLLPSLIPKLRRTAPDLKLIILLCDPVRRIVSRYTQLELQEKSNYRWKGMTFDAEVFTSGGLNRSE